VTTWRDLLDHAERVLREAGMSAPDVEARWIVEEASGVDLGNLLVYGSRPATRLAVARIDEMLERRTAGEPLQYVLGSWSFRGLDLLVDRRALIPRPETEITAELAIEEVLRLGERTGPADPWAGAATSYAVVDLGTGSGAIALALAAELPEAEVWATDVSEDALAVARANLAGAGSPAARIRLAQGSWFAALPADLRGRLRLVVSNPPYVSEGEYQELPTELHHEPMRALVSGPTGLEAIDTIVSSAPAWLAPAGALVCEIAPHHAEHAIERARLAGFADVFVRHDMTGRQRVLVARGHA
jgi:release factor glutamine methyltransferase